MRGDSLRDFYAKTLAVLGLGLLAAAGAVVDYWPVGGDLPPVPAVANLRHERVMPGPVLAADVPEPRVLRASYQHHDQSQSQSQAGAKARAASGAFARSFRAVQFAEPVVLVEPVMPVPEFDLTRIEPTWSSPFEPLSIVLDAEPPPVPIAMNAADSRPLLTGAVSALKKTSASIREAFRGVVGRIRKVSPFFDTTTVPSFR